MLTALLAFCTALLAGLPQLLMMIETRTTKRNHDSNALAQVEVDELDADMQRVDDELRQLP